MMSLSATRTLLRSPHLRELREAPIEGARFLVRAWAAIFAVEASLNTLGYRRTLAWVEAVPASRSRRRRLSVELGERLVRTAYRAHAFRGGCLPRSLVQYLLHRRDGTAARFVVGVRRATSGDRSGATSGDRSRATSRAEVAANGGADRGIEAHAWVASPEIQTSPGFAPIFETGGPGWSPVGASAKGDRPSSLRRPGR